MSRTFRQRSRRPRLEGLEDRLAPATFNVNSTADVLSPPTGTVTLRSAIQAANSTTGDNTINLTVAGTYQITLAGTAGETDNAAGEFAILPTGGTLTITNTSGGSAIIDGNQLARVFDINPGATTPASTSAVSISNVTIQNGKTAGDGGGIRDQGPINVTLTTVTVANNSAGGAGSGFADADGKATLSVQSSLFQGNAASGNGGAIEGGTTTTITNSEFKANTAGGSGGAVFDNGVTLTVNAATFATNKAGGNGGAIELLTSGSGSTNGSTITNVTITGNNATGNGGGIDTGTGFSGGVTLISDTINANTAATGGGVYYSGASGTSFFLTTTIVAKNTAPTGPDADNAAGNFSENGGQEDATNLIGVSGTGSGNSGFQIFPSLTKAGTVSTPLDPQLASLANNGGPTVGAPGNSLTLETEALLPNSPALDAAAAGAAIDERGFGRTQESFMTDIGAYEMQRVDLNLMVAANSPVLPVGTTATFTITVSILNVATSVSASDDLPADNSMLTVALPSGLTATSPVSFLVGAIAKGNSKTFTVTATVTAPGSQTVTANFTGPDVTGSNSVTVTNTFVPLGLAVTTTSPFEAVGRTVPFTVTITNQSGQVAGTTAVTLPANTATVTVALPPGLTASGPLTFTLGALPAGQSTTFTIPAMVTAAGSQTVSATVTSPSSNPTSTTTTTTFTLLTAQEGFVQAVYLDELGRSGAVGELDYWVGKLNGGATQTAVASTILHTQEARDHLVKGWYQTFLGRSAVNGEEQFWVNQLLAGQTEEQVLSSLLGTGEFLNHAVALNGNGSPQQSFVNALYQLLLNRSPNGTDLSYWINQVQMVGQQGVALAFLTMPEYRTDTVTGYYNNLLHRPPDTNGLTYWVNSGLDLATVRGNIEGTPEFFTNG